MPNTKVSALVDEIDIPNSKHQPILLLGARSLVSTYLVPMLLEHNFDVTCISRAAKKPTDDYAKGATWKIQDISADTAIKITEGVIVISLLPLWLLPPAISKCEGASQVIAFSSTSALTKIDSDDEAERQLAMKLREAEQALKDKCSELGMRWTILRPTLIYGGGLDQNISVIAKLMRRFRVFPLPGRGKGLRQPVHGGDLATAALAAINNPAAFDTTFNLPGGETLTYAEMVKRVAGKIDGGVLVLRLPEGLLKICFAIAKRIGFSKFGAAMIARTNQDLVFDTAAARQYLSYKPRDFDPEIYHKTIKS